MTPALACCRQLVGPHLHATVMIGGCNIKADAGDLGLDSTWVDTEARPPASLTIGGWPASQNS